MIERSLAARVRAAAERFPAVTLTGPRQSGKSTLCRALFSGHEYANLETPDVREFALADPRGFLAQFADGVIIDEVQWAPKLLSYLQPMIDDDPVAGRWILTGSQNLALLETVSQSLAGRSAVLHLLPLTYEEIMRFETPPMSLEEVLLTGGYPPIYDRGIPADEWLGAYVATYVERDVRSIATIGDLVTFQRFLELCAGRTSQLINYSNLAADTGITQPTSKAWLSILEASFLVHRLPGWSGNVRKRLVKMPKLHFHDTGLVCWLLGIRTVRQLRSHPLRGAIFETWVISELLKHRANAGERGGMHFYRDRNGVEADALIDRAAGLAIIEAKAGMTITNDMLARSGRIRQVLENVDSPQSYLVYGGDVVQNRREATVLPWNALASEKWT